MIWGLGRRGRGLLFLDSREPKARMNANSMFQSTVCVR
jgi:hypothetical protein